MKLFPQSKRLTRHTASKLSSGLQREHRHQPRRQVDDHRGQDFVAFEPVGPRRGALVTGRVDGPARDRGGGEGTGGAQGGAVVDGGPGPPPARIRRGQGRGDALTSVSGSRIVGGR